MKTIPLVHLLLIIQVSHAHITSDEAKNWIDACDVFSRLAFPLKDKFTQLIDEILISDEERIPMSITCRHQLRDFSNGLRNNRLDAHAMLDSFSKVAAGVINWQGTDLGSYSQCLEYGRYVILGIQFPLPEDTRSFRLPVNESDNELRKPVSGPNVDWRVKFSETMGLNRLTPYHLPICLPDGCIREDIESVISSEWTASQIYPLKVVHIHEESLSDENSLSLKQKLAIAPFVVLLFLVPISTILTYYYPFNQLPKFIRAFDAVSNTKTLFRRKNPEFNDPLSSLKFGQYIGGSAGHTAFFLQKNIFAQPLAFMQWIESLSHSNPIKLFMPSLLTLMFSIPLHASFLSTVIWVPIMQKVRISFTDFVSIRVLRMWPLIIAYILFTQSLPLISNGGPLTSLLQKSMAENCANNGWKDILFINNLFGDAPQDFCIYVGWMFSVDMQLSILSFFTLTTLAKNRSLGVKMIVAQIIIGIILSGYRFIQTGLSDVFDVRILSAYESLTTYSRRTHHTILFIPVYGVGMLFGTFVFLNQKGAKRSAGIGWIVALALLPFMFIAGSLYDGSDSKTSYTVELIYNACIRTVVSIFMAAVVYLKMHDQTLLGFWSLIDRVANSRFVVILGRLNFAMFMVHTIVINFAYSTFESTRVSLIFMLMAGTCSFIASTIAAYLVYIFIERPFAILLTPDGIGIGKEKRI